MSQAISPVRCMSCDELNPDTATRCASCGAALPAGVQSAMQAPPAGQPFAAPPPAMAYGLNLQNTMYGQPSASPVVVVNNGSSGPNLVVRIVWFLFIGLWLGALATFVGYVLCLLIVTLPVGVIVLNNLPGLMTLRPASSSTRVTVAGGVTVVDLNMRAQQHSFLLRALYFLLFGWWFAGIWLFLAWGFVSLSILTFGLTLAVAFMMFDRVPQVMTLRVN